MLPLARGQRLRLSSLTAWPVVRVGIDLGGIAVDVACFGLDRDGRLADDRYLVFYNQPVSPCGGVRLVEHPEFPACFELTLGQLPEDIARLVFTAAVDGAGTMRQMTEGRIVLLSQDRALAAGILRGSDFDQERALMLLELYPREGAWRLSLTGQGFNGGLAALVRHFGGTVEDR